MREILLSEDMSSIPHSERIRNHNQQINERKTLRDMQCITTLSTVVAKMVGLSLYWDSNSDTEK